MSRSATPAGQELIDGRRHIDTCEAAWLDRLADFDTWGTWAEDGHSHAAPWLVSKCGMSRSTAKEKLRVAHEMSRRPVIREAFVAGDLPYSKVRLITRVERGDEEVDAKFVAHAKEDSFPVLEGRVKRWQMNADQDKEPRDLSDRFGVFRQHGFCGGTGRIIIEAADEDLDRIVNAIDAYLDYLFNNSKDAEPVDKAPMEPPTDDDGSAELFVEEAPMEPDRTFPQRRLDALLDLIEEIVLVRDDQVDPERAAIGVTIDYDSLINRVGGANTDSGAVLNAETVRRLACDAGIHRIIVKGASEILDVGRKTRTWNRAQRRAIRSRHGFRCAAHGCDRRITQIHHIHWWENGGETNVDNGVPVCLYHHHLLHEGRWKLTWDKTTGTVEFTGPRGQTIRAEASLRTAA